jgi:hypothetical protein
MSPDAVISRKGKSNEHLIVKDGELVWTSEGDAMSISVNEPRKSHDELVRERAYAIWLERIARGQPGTAESDWRIAELEVKDDRR